MTDLQPRESDSQMKTMAIPCGLTVAYINKAETEYVYKEVFEERVYFRHGIILSDNDVVFDVGANIGLFSMFIKEQFPNVSVHCFEPSEETLSVLKFNMSRYGDMAVVYPCGLSNETKVASFTYYPRYSIISGFHADMSADKDIVRKGVLNEWRQRFPGKDDPDDRFLDSLVEKTLGDKRVILCPLRTVSEILREKNIAELGLLKVDAEGSELEILMGIDGKDWPKVRQIVMEIHDHGGKVRTEITRILSGHGFELAFDEENLLSSTGIVNCYARRSAQRQ